jgi:hypothetical protein
VSTMLEQTAPVILLQRAAEAARLIVIGQHHSSWLERLMLGSVASPLCSKAVCPAGARHPARQAPGILDPVGRPDGAEARGLPGCRGTSSTTGYRGHRRQAGLLLGHRAELLSTLVELILRTPPSLTRP